MKGFGIELEGYGLTNEEIIAAVIGAVGGRAGRRMMSEEVVAQAEARDGIPITIVDNSHTHHGPTFTNGHTWQIMADGSVAGRNPFEVVSPILDGSRGEAQARKVIRALNLAGAKTNTSAGLHITHGANNSRWQRLGARKMAKVIHRLTNTYAYFAQAFNSILAPSRTNAYYCQIRTHSLAECRTITDRYNHFHKYSAVNLSKLILGGCIEYRQHQSSFNHIKIMNWAKLTHKLQTVALNEENTSRDIHNYPQTIEGLMDFLQMPSALKAYFIGRSVELNPNGMVV